jgi:hypothetical protein
MQKLVLHHLPYYTSVYWRWFRKVPGAVVVRQRGIICVAVVKAWWEEQWPVSYVACSRFSSVSSPWQVTDSRLGGSALPQACELDAVSWLTMEWMYFCNLPNPLLQSAVLGVLYKWKIQVWGFLPSRVTIQKNNFWSIRARTSCLSARSSASIHRKTVPLRSRS